MRDAVIVSTARTPIGKAYRGAFNATTPQALAAHAIAHAVERAGRRPGRDQRRGDRCRPAAGPVRRQYRASGRHPRRPARDRGGHVAGPAMRVGHDGDCHGGQAGGAWTAWTSSIGGGVDSISMVQTPEMRVGCRPVAEGAQARHLHDHAGNRRNRRRRATVSAARRRTPMPLQSQHRTAAAQEAGRFDAEIVPMTTIMKVQNKETGKSRDHEVTLDKDEGNRPGTTPESLAGLQPVFKDGMSIKEGKFITAGNATQLSDGASAAVVMEAKLAEQRGPEAAGPLCRRDGGGLRARRDGHRPGLCRAKTAGRPWPEDGRYRPVGTERSLRRAGALFAATSWAFPMSF